MSTKLKQAEELEPEPEPVGELTRLALEREGWEFYQSDDESWIGENVDRGYRTPGGVAFTKEDAVRAVIVWMRKQEEKTVPEDWFRKAPVPDDPQNRVVEDLSDAELQRLAKSWLPETAIAKAIGLELQRRDAAFRSGVVEEGEKGRRGEGEIDEDWFLNFELPGGRVMSDLTDAELSAIVNDPEPSTLPKGAVNAAENLIEWRKERDLAERLQSVEVPAELQPEGGDDQERRSAYQRYRAESRTLTLVQLIGELAKADESVHSENYALRRHQALRDEMNSRQGNFDIDDNGAYAVNENTAVLLFEPQMPSLLQVDAYIALLETPMGWIYGYSWQRGKAETVIPLTTREVFVERQSALERAVEVFCGDNSELQEYRYPADADCAAALRQWAKSLIAPTVMEMVKAEAAPMQSSLFDYSALDEETGAYARQTAIEIRFILKRTVSDIVEIGNKLSEVKRRLAGHFVDWLKAEFEMSERFARNCMAVAREFDPSDVETIPLKALYQLAAAPEEVKQEIVERAKAGEVITTETVTTTIKKHKQVEAARSPQLPIVAPATVAGDISELELVDESSEPAQAEVVATGRTTADLLSLLKATPSGMHLGLITKMGFTEAQVEAARTDRRIEKRDLQYCYAWTPEDVVAALREHGPLNLEGFAELGCTKRAVEAAVIDGMIVENLKGEFRALDSQGRPEPEKPKAPAATVAAGTPTITETLEGHALVVSYTFLPALKGKVNVSVRVGDDAKAVAFELLDALEVRLPDRVMEMVIDGVVAAKTKPESAATATKKGRAKSPAASKKTGSANKVAPAKAKAKPVTKPVKKAPAKARK